MLAGIQQRIRFRAEPGGKTWKQIQKRRSVFWAVSEREIGAIIGSGIFGSLPTVINDIGTGIVLALLATIVYTLAKTIPNVYLSSVAPASGSFFNRTDEADPSGGWCVFMAAQNLLQPVLISVFCGVVWRLFCGAVPGAGRI